MLSGRVLYIPEYIRTRLCVLKYIYLCVLEYICMYPDVPVCFLPKTACKFPLCVLLCTHMKTVEGGAFLNETESLFYA